MLFVIKKLPLLLLDLAARRIFAAYWLLPYLTCALIVLGGAALLFGLTAPTAGCWPPSS